MLRTAISIIDRITTLSALLAGLIILFLIIVNSYAVISRYLFNRPIDWILDVSQLMMAACVFIGTAYVLRKDMHVNVDIVISFLPDKTKRKLSKITSIFVFMFCLVLTWKTWELFWGNLYTRTSSVVQLPMFPCYFAVFYGSCLLMLESLCEIFSIAEE